MTTVLGKKVISTSLFLAAIYNIIYGSYLILFPYHFFSVFEMEPPRYIEFWQCIGMIVGVYGVGYLVASRDPVQHYAIVLVGFMGKVFGPIGFIGALVKETLPLEFGIMIIFNDLIWWPSFYYWLKKAFIEHKFRI